MFCTDTHSFQPAVLRRGPVVVPTYKRAHRGTEDLIPGLRDPGRKLDLHPALPSYIALRFPGRDGTFMAWWGKVQVTQRR